MSTSILIATDIDEEILRGLARDASVGPFYLIEDDGSVDDVLAHQASMLHLGDGSCFSVGVADEEVGLPETRCVAFTGNGPRSAANAKWIGAASPEVVLRIFDGLHESIDYHRGHAARMEVELQQALGDFNGLLEQLEHDEPMRAELWLLRRRVEARDVAFAAAVEGANLARKEADEARAEAARLEEVRQVLVRESQARAVEFEGILEAARSQLREVTAERDRLRPLVAKLGLWRDLHGIAADGNGDDGGSAADDAEDEIANVEWELIVAVDAHRGGRPCDAGPPAGMAAVVTDAALRLKRICESIDANQRGLILPGDLDIANRLLQLAQAGAPFTAEGATAILAACRAQASEEELGLPPLLSSCPCAGDVHDPGCPEDA